MDTKRLQEILERFSQHRIVIFGDFFLDKYLIIDPKLNEISIETGKTAYQVVGKRPQPGAAGTVCNNLQALGIGEMVALSVIGDDGERLESFFGTDKKIWILSIDEHTQRNKKMYQYDGESFTTILDFNRIAPNPNFPQIKSIVEMENGDLWMGLWHSLGPLLHRKSGETILFDDRRTFPGTGSSILLDVGNHRIWCTGGNEVTEYDGSAWRIVIEGIDNARDIIKDHQGCIWVAAKNGVHCYNPNQSHSLVRYTVQDGLPINNAEKLFEDSQGNIWVGTLKGVSKFNYDADTSPPIVWMVQGKNSETITSDGNAQFVFEGIDKWRQTQKERLLYSYRIDEGLWSEFQSDTIASFKAITPGMHTFQVRAMDLNWNVDSTPASFEFTVLLPWYKEPAFLVIIIIGTVLILFFASYAINRHIHLRWSYETLRHTQNQLVQSEKMASLGQLVAGVAHEINNPINFIKSNIQPLKEYFSGFIKVLSVVDEGKDCLPEDMLRKYEMISEEEDLKYAREDTDKLIQSFEDGSSRITKIVADLRQYSRVDKDYHSPFDIHEAIESSLRLLTGRYKDHVTVHKEYSDIPQIVCSPGQINQVFMNILKNAGEFIEGDGNIWIKTYQEDNNVVVKIRDDGKGIPQENISKVFDPFFTTKPVGAGTGLGLSLSYGIVEQHGGTITVDSKAGEGTEFTVILPITKNE